MLQALIASGHVSEEVAAEVIGLQQREGLGVLAALAWVGVPEEAVARTLAGLWNLPFLDLSAGRPEAAALALVPHRIARTHRVLPMRIEAGWILVATADPDILAMDEIRSVTGLAIRIGIASKAQIERHLEAAYAQEAAS